MNSKNKNNHKRKASILPLGVTSVQKNLSQAIAYQNARKFDNAQAIYEEILRSEPNNFDALHLLGVIYLQRDQYELASRFLNQAISINPNFADAVFHRGLNYKMQFKFDLALSDYSRALEINPSHQNALLESGCIYEANEQLEKAMELFNKAIEINDGFILARLNKINILRRLKQFDLAMKEVNFAIQMAPNYALTYSQKAMILTDQHQFEDAIQFSDKALSLGSGDGELAQLYSQRGIIYRGLWKLEEAANSFQKAIELAPNLVDAYANLGLALTDLGRLENALPVFERGLSINPNHHACRFNYSMSKLLNGDLVDGFQQYECRRNMFNWGTENKSAEWTGKEWLGGKTILVLCEQGMGDTIQFARYATILASIAEKVVLQVQAPLMEIMSSLEGGITLISEGDPHPRYDYYCFLMSLPHLFGTDLGSVPSRISYLKASDQKVNIWKHKLAGFSGKKKVGLVWSGGFRADRPELWAVNSRRNISFEKVSRLIDERCDWFSLQKGEPAESELRDFQAQSSTPVNLNDFSAQFNDFADTAAFIENLDLVISVDTSTAHMAAALGKPTWILNRFDSCWRWLLDRKDTPWYPTVSVYRQSNSGNWDGVIDQVLSDLTSFIAK